MVSSPPFPLSPTQNKKEKKEEFPSTLNRINSLSPHEVKKETVLAEGPAARRPATTFSRMESLTAAMRETIHGTPLKTVSAEL